MKDKRKRYLVTAEALILFVIAILVIVFCGSDESQKEFEQPFGDYEIGDKQEVLAEAETEREQPVITFTGYGKYAVSVDMPTVELNNPDNNFVDMVFTVTDKESNMLIARTDRVAPGDYAYINIMDFYPTKGVYTLSISTATYDRTTNQQMNGIYQEMEVLVNK